MWNNMDSMRERGKSEKLMKYIEGIYAMLEELEECIEEETTFGERDDRDYGRMGDRMGERRSARTGRYIR